jgi:hypothetical protein
MRAVRWWLAQKLFHLSCRVMPSAERTVMTRLLKLGTDAIRKEIEADQ